MSSRRPRTAPPARTALDWLEEALHLLRSAPLSVHAAWATGAVPFLLAFTYFWADMATSPALPALNRLPAASLALALAFLWHKLWQTIFLARLQQHLTLGQRPAGPWPLSRLLRVLAIHLRHQPWGLLLVPLTSGTALSYFQNLLLLAAQHTCPSATANLPVTADGRPLALPAHARSLALLWPRAHAAALLILTLLVLILHLNLLALTALLPGLLNSITGFDLLPPGSGGPSALLNSTTTGTLLLLSCLLADPLLKSYHLLRCYHGDSLRSGLDLRTDALRLFPPSAKSSLPLALAIPLTFALALTLATLPLRASPPPPSTSPPPPPATSQAIPPEPLRQTIADTLRQTRYQWRKPRSDDPAPNPTFLESLLAPLRNLLNSIGTTLGSWFTAAIRQIADLINFIIARLHLSPPTATAPGLPVPPALNWASLAQGVAFLLLPLLLALILWLILRARRLARLSSVKSTAPEIIAAPATPDLARDDLSGAELPEDAWLRLARQHHANGELRLATRAHFLANLAALATRRYLTLARFKTNLDYHHELTRRSSAAPALPPLLQTSIHTFERTWFGSHPATEETIQTLNQIHQEIQKSQ